MTSISWVNNIVRLEQVDFSKLHYKVHRYRRKYVLQRMRLIAKKAEIR